MNAKRSIAWLLVLVLTLGLFAGCGKTETTAETITETTQEAVEIVTSG